MAVRQVYWFNQAEYDKSRFWYVRLGAAISPAEKSFAGMKHREKGGDFSDQRKGKYYLFLAELLAFNNSDNREGFLKVLRSVDMTGFVRILGVSPFGDTLGPFCHLLVTPKNYQFYGNIKKTVSKLIQLKNI
ncbi:hypothetical protein [Priestia taiwanensis]|uniref:Uncharacterized protein n=1 Tax=Priestia taiwanensis TaxID=1347902 RepID=A0A917AX19_9BACI|nr:hypothetical protein [Priestia taiwanensis]MBM7365294.1 hypothetical protein [Priestia taiwanensis]GGE86041.1 hypothetical protein GCM10007140_39290 [Priestia taiwanensis]